ncbi:hypothetical protein K9M74_05700, partial [Candidatus Woesearchaeota archaeon]|nr:hypothetical protein [Candidatus Woesearchaeota archaeon]
SLRSKLHYMKKREFAWQIITYNLEKLSQSSKSLLYWLWRAITLNKPLILAYLFNSPSGEIPLVDDISNIRANESRTIRPEFITTELEIPPSDFLETSSSLTQALQATDPDTMSNYCNAVIDEQDKDICYSRVAERFSEGIYCESIVLEELRDNCYVTLILSGQNSFCDSLSLPENQLLCI